MKPTEESLTAKETIKMVLWGSLIFFTVYFLALVVAVNNTDYQNVEIPKKSKISGFKSKRP